VLLCDRISLSLAGALAPPFLLAPLSSTRPLAPSAVSRTTRLPASRIERGGRHAHPPTHPPLSRVATTDTDTDTHTHTHTGARTGRRRVWGTHSHPTNLPPSRSLRGARPSAARDQSGRVPSTARAPRQRRAVAERGAGINSRERHNTRISLSFSVAPPSLLLPHPPALDSSRSAHPLSRERAARRRPHAYRPIGGAGGASAARASTNDCLPPTTLLSPPPTPFPFRKDDDND
jgi:hypothetical protein